jgi:hypothetical protein
LTCADDALRTLTTSFRNRYNASSSFSVPS